MGPREIWDALVAGARGVLPIAATTAAAGIIVAVVSLTGLGLKLAGLIVDLAGGSLTLTAIFSAIAVLILGLAVPVTASFIIAAAVVAPALIALGVEDFAAYMFIFYYAVLSEVSPPTALSAVRRGGDHRRQRLQDDDAHLPLHAAGVPGAVRVHPRRRRARACCCRAAPATIAFAVVVSIIAVIALGLALEGWLKGEISLPARLVIGVAALLLLWLEPTVTADRPGRARRRPRPARAHAETAARRGLSSTAPATAATHAADGRRPAGTAATPTAVPTCAAVLSRPETAPRSASADGRGAERRRRHRRRAEPVAGQDAPGDDATRAASARAPRSRRRPARCRRPSARRRSSRRPTGRR